MTAILADVMWFHLYALILALPVQDAVWFPSRVLFQFWTPSTEMTLYVLNCNHSVSSMGRRPGHLGRIRILFFLALEVGLSSFVVLCPGTRFFAIAYGSGISGGFFHSAIFKSF